MSKTHLICPQPPTLPSLIALLVRNTKVQKGIKVKIARQNLGRLLFMTHPKLNRPWTEKYDKAPEKNTRKWHKKNCASPFTCNSKASRSIIHEQKTSNYTQSYR